MICEKFPSKIPNYIKSYRIEQEFYKNNNGYIGIEIPHVFLIYKNHLKLKYILTMEDLTFISDHFLSKDRNLYNISIVVSKIAKFHEHFWNKKLNYEIWKNGGYWTGNKRNEDKKKFQENFNLFKIHFLNLLNITNDNYNVILSHIQKSESNINEYYLSNETLIHGDLKFENLFICTNKNVYVIDWQWFGYGNCATEIMYLLFTSLSAEFLNIENIILILLHYCENNKCIKFNKLYHDFKIASFDFFIYLICCKWYNITLEILNQNDLNKKDGLHIRKIDQIQKIFSIILEFCNSEVI